MVGYQSFLGHALPAMSFVGIGGFMLALTLKRCRDLSTSYNNVDGSESPSFCDVHNPERNSQILHGLGIIIMSLTTFGMIVEAGGSLKDGFGFSHQLAHQALYLCFFFVGAVACLEARKLVIPDTSRVVLSFVFLLQYVLWNEHGRMKDDPSDARVHLLQAHINLAAALAFGYSTYCPKSLLAYVAGWSLMLLNGLWMFTAGLTLYCIDIMTHTVGAALVLEALFVAAMLILGAVYLSWHQENDGDGKTSVSFSKAGEDETAELDLAERY
mmetsp:Transcript_54372/g.80660  ORF Transcript_54372/g.80660 Transcript_54372/m.80660 type:complete len:270 (-) Transcript_54372:173-982(-)|eukprot:CAMPEP_0195528582 /NCGR_PEP_ID=MMETSP0794_2-20130614/30776_1 /TAXON_ID=515487 /ORGANISM="Stephanopyxis turris, Strain CCMP 815" /LENGTH=269 /DNA_ID=CAMNT_0040659741 /DNA_START=99 /DNA_END=908 /DNA_ORIENTATION=+